MSETESLRAAWNAWRPWAYPYSETGMCEMCGEIDGHGLVDEGDPHERPCLVGAYAAALARLEAADRLERLTQQRRCIQHHDVQGEVFVVCGYANCGEITADETETGFGRLAALAREETPSPDAGRGAGPGFKSPVGQNG